MPTVTYHAHLEGRTAAISFDGLRLNPGPNDLEPGAVERLQRHPDLAGYVERGVIELPELPSPPSPLSQEGEGGLEQAQPKNDTVTFLVNLNTATLEELMALPRIGEATAKKLIAARPLASHKDAQHVAGMSDTRWADVTPYLSTNL